MSDNTQMDGLYLNKVQGEHLMFPYDYKQTFEHESKLFPTPKEYVLVNEFYHLDDELQSIELEVLKFLRDFGFATETQIRILLSAKGLNTDLMKKVLDRCVQDRVINYFTLSQFVLDKIPEDAFRIYCLDHGARHILTHFSERDYLMWLSSDNIRSSELVAKYIMTGMFYLQLYAVRGESLCSFQPLADFSIGKRDIRFSSSFQIMQNFMPHDFIFEVIRHNDLPVQWQKKVNEKIAPFAKGNFWKMYYHKLPVFIFLAQNYEDALQVADIFYMRTGIEEFRIVTDPVLMQGLNNAIMYSYVPANEKNPEATLKKVRPKIFRTET